jgi:hypothetical protein
MGAAGESFQGKDGLNSKALLNRFGPTRERSNFLNEFFIFVDKRR